jgi:hypothetical protein
MPLHVFIDGREERFFAEANYPCAADRPVRPL